MVVIVGQVLKDNVPVVGAKVKVVTWDKVSGVTHSSDEMTADEDGTFQYGTDHRIHQNFSIESEVLVAAWEDELPIGNTHEILGTSIYTYSGEALIVADVSISPKEDIIYGLDNSLVVMDQKETVSYSPIFSSENQKEYFHGVSIFPQSRVSSVYMENDAQYIAPYNLYFIDFGTYTINVAGENTFGETFIHVLTVNVREVAADSIPSFDDIDIDAGLAFFAIKDQGIKENIFNANIFSTSSYVLESAEFFFDNVSQRVETEFSSFGVSITLPPSVAETIIVRMETLGYVGDDTELTSYTFELQVGNYSTLEGIMTIVYDEPTSKHTASIDLGNSVNLVKVLWQVTYESTLLQRVLAVDEIEQIGLIDVLYQDYLDPSVESITFEALRGGIYTVSAYAINTAGIYVKISDTLEVSGGEIPEDEINAGDTVTIACTSLNYATPIMNVYRLSQDGYVSVAITAMTQSFDTTYISEYTVEHTDSLYVFNVNGSIAVKKVGDPSGCVVAVNEKADFVDLIPYIMTGFDGIEIESGTLSETDYGVYYTIMAEGIHGILEVGKTKKVI